VFFSGKLLEVRWMNGWLGEISVWRLSWFFSNGRCDWSTTEQVPDVLWPKLLM
jgi:hypothetical protein